LLQHHTAPPLTPKISVEVVLINSTILIEEFETQMRKDGDDNFNWREEVKKKNKKEIQVVKDKRGALKFCKMGDRYLLLSGLIELTDLKELKSKKINKEHSVGTPFYKNERFYLFSRNDMIKIKEYGYEIYITNLSELKRHRKKKFSITPIDGHYYFIGKQILLSDYVYLRLKGWLERKDDYKVTYRRVGKEGIEFLKKAYPNMKIRTEAEIQKRRNMANGRIILTGKKSGCIRLREYEDDGEWLKWLKWLNFTDIADFDKGYLYFNNLVYFYHSILTNGINSHYYKEDSKEKDSKEKDKEFTSYNLLGLYIIRRLYKNLRYEAFPKIDDDDFIPIDHDCDVVDDEALWDDDDGEWDFLFD